MAKPYLRALPSLGLAWRKRRTEQRPLQAVFRAVGAGEVRGQVPPLDPVVGMGSMILREFEPHTRFWNGETFSVGAEPGEALSEGVADAQQQEKQGLEQTCVASPTLHLLNSLF